MQHLQWLIEQADRFGTSSVARTADETVGALVRASTAIKHPEWLPRWKRQFVSLVATVVLLTTGATASQHALEASAGTLAAVEDNIRAADGVVDAVQDFGDDSRPDEAPP